MSKNDNAQLINGFAQVWLLWLHVNKYDMTCNSDKQYNTI